MQHEPRAARGHVDTPGAALHGPAEGAKQLLRWNGDMGLLCYLRPRTFAQKKDMNSHFFARSSLCNQLHIFALHRVHRVLPDPAAHAVLRDYAEGPWSPVRVGFLHHEGQGALRDGALWFREVAGIDVGGGGGSEDDDEAADSGSFPPDGADLRAGVFPACVGVVFVSPREGRSTLPTGEGR